MIKTVIHTILIKKQSQKSVFQIKLPNGSRRINSIRVSGTPKPKESNIQEVGLINLFTPKKAEAFFSEIIKYPKPRFWDKITKPFQGFLKLGRLEQFIDRDFLSLRMPLNTRIVEGFYEDYMGDENAPYLLRIYLEIQMK